METSRTIAQFLAAQGVGTFAGTNEWSINIAVEPATPVGAITIYDTGGGEPDTDNLSLLHKTIQIRTRNNVYAKAYSKQEQIRDLLILNSPVAGLTDVQMSSDILSIGRDTNDNHILTSNYRILQERA
jgi:hypothetical protein